jgi:putative restriction endonuclease
MRITFQPSSGRGEYELSENSPNGIRPIDLVGHLVNLRLDNLTIETHVKVTTDQGKYRLRVSTGSSLPQVQNQIACALLMPKPIRTETKTEAGQPVIQAEAYIIKNINLDNIVITGANTFTADVTTLDCQNKTVIAEQLLVVQRMRDIQRIWQQRDKLPSDISVLLAQHERIIRSGSSIPKTVEKLIRDLQALTEQYNDESDTPYTKGTYVVPALLAMIDGVIEEVPLSLEQINPEQIELKRREIKKWQIYASKRGASSALFRKQVQAAYDYRCLMCGCRYPPTMYNKNPGIDAAHIIPWSQVDLDEIYNGIALCKLHHWAFDEGILRILYRDGTYHIEMPFEVIEGLTSLDFNLDELQRVVGPIPTHYLPQDPVVWPKPQLLERLLRDTALLLE